MKCQWLLASLATVSSLLSFAQAQNCAISTDVDYDFEVSPMEGFTVFWTPNSEAETVSFKVEYIGEAWISMGFSLTGEMDESDAVIALPEDDSVLEYIMTSKSISGINLSPMPEITDAAYTQAQGMTTITFTRPAAPVGEGKNLLSLTPGMESVLVWAVGSGNQFGYHLERGSLAVDVACMDVADLEEGVVTSDAPTPSPTVAVLDCLSSDPEYSFETSPASDFAVFWSVLNDTYISVKAVYQGEAWVSVGFSESGSMFPADAVIGLPDDATALEYDLISYQPPQPSDMPDLMEGSITQADGVTTLTFVRPLVPSAVNKMTLPLTMESPWIWAVGRSNAYAIHADRGSFPVIVAGCTDTSAGVKSSAPALTGVQMALALVLSVAFMV